MKNQTIDVDGFDAEFKKRLDAWLAAHYRENLSAEQIARGMLMHRSWLHRKMKAALGLSLKQYLVLYRIEQAKQLFASSMALKEIAYEVGFNDYRDFARQINQLYHMPPRSMRSLLRSSRKG